MNEKFGNEIDSKIKNTTDLKRLNNCNWSSTFERRRRQALYANIDGEEAPSVRLAASRPCSRGYVEDVEIIAAELTAGRQVGRHHNRLH